MDESGRNRRQAREEIARMRAGEQRRRRRRSWMLGTGGLAVAAIALIAIIVSVTGAGSRRPGRQAAGAPALKRPSPGTLRPAGPAGRTGPEGVPVPAAAPLAGTAGAASGQAVDGISCNPGEMFALHIHAHLTIFVNGSPRQLPLQIGIPGAREKHTPQGPFALNGSCYYWLHTHAADGIIHIESPVKRSFTLGEFFDEWGQPLSPARVGPAAGPVVAFYNGQRYKGSPRNIPLSAFAQIQLEVGRPLIAPESISFPSKL